MKLSLPLLLLDLGIVWLFSYSGMKFHALTGDLWGELWRIALPFSLGYPLGMWACQAYDETSSRRFFYRSFFMGLGLGLTNSFLLRAAQRGEWPSLQFVVAACLFFLLSTVAVRSVYWKFHRRGSEHGSETNSVPDPDIPSP